jgi:hypothetical protein
MTEHTRRWLLRTGAAASAAVLGAGTAAASEGKGENAKAFGKVWADGTLFRTLDGRPDPDDPIYFLNDGNAPVTASVRKQGSPFVSVSSPGEQGWNGGQWTHISAEVTDVEAFEEAVKEDGPFASSERLEDTDFIETTLGRPTNDSGEPFGPPAFFICPLNGKA